MRAAFVSGTVTALVAGLVGYFVVLRAQAFAGDALTHVAFTGSLGALIAGLNPEVGLVGATMSVGTAMGLLGGRVRARDEAIGTALAWVLGLGVLFLNLISRQSSAANGSIGINLLFGSIFGLTASQVDVSVIGGLATITFILAIAQPLLFASLDRDVAEARGVPVRLLEAVFLGIVGIAVAEAVPAVGALMVLALMVTPAATVQRFVRRPFATMLLSAALAVLLLWVSLLLAISLSVPVSFLVSALGCGFYVATRVWQSIRI